MSPRKRVLVVIAGAADPAAEDTPLSDAERTALDRVARLGRCGTLDVRADSPWGGFTALLGLADRPTLGFAEAAGAGVEVREGSAVYRADFVTVADGILGDPFGGRVRGPEADALLAAVAAVLPEGRFVRLAGHRNLAVFPGAAPFAPTPWEMVGQRPAAGLPAEGPPRAVFDASAAVLSGHDVNAVRVDLGENPANALWLHGGGPPEGPPLLPAALAGGGTLVGRGAATAGLARMLGLAAVVVDGDDEALAAAALSALGSSDLVVVRTESVLDAATSGDPLRKRDAISAVDARLVAPLLSAAEEQDDHAFAVAVDSVLDVRTHLLQRRALPCAVLVRGGTGGGGVFTERACDASGLRFAASGALLEALGPASP